MSQGEEEQDKKNQTKPYKFLNLDEPEKSLENIEALIKSYFDSCDPHTEERMVENGVSNKGETIFIKRKIMTEQEPYLITGLALALDTTRRTLLEYQDAKHYPEDFPEDIRNQIIHTITRAKVRCEKYAERHLFTAKQANGAIFSLKNNHNWEDTKKVENLNRDVTGDLDDLERGRKELGENAKVELNKNDSQGSQA